jgi:hypothetical protein
VTADVRPEVVERRNEILVSVDLMADVAKDADMHTVDEAIILRHAAMAVAKAAKELAAALDVHLCSVMEVGEAVDFKGWQFRRGTTKAQERFDHDEIGKRVIDRAEQNADEHLAETGHLRPTRTIAGDVVRMMTDIYLSESTKAKVTQLDRYGIPRNPKSDDSVFHYKRGEPCITIEPSQSQGQE